MWGTQRGGCLFILMVLCKISSPSSFCQVAERLTGVVGRLDAQFGVFSYKGTAREGPRWRAVTPALKTVFKKPFASTFSRRALLFVCLWIWGLLLNCALDPGAGGVWSEVLFSTSTLPTPCLQKLSCVRPFCVYQCWDFYWGWRGGWRLVALGWSMNRSCLFYGNTEADPKGRTVEAERERGMGEGVRNPCATVPIIYKFTFCGFCYL